MSPSPDRSPPDDAAAPAEAADAAAAVAAGRPAAARPSALRRVLAAPRRASPRSWSSCRGRASWATPAARSRSDGRGPRRQPAHHRALGHRQRRRPRAPQPGRPGRGAPRAGPRRHRPRRLPRPEPQRAPEPGLGPAVARPDHRSSRSPATTRSTGYAASAEARLRRRLGGAPRAAPGARARRRRPGRRGRRARPGEPPLLPRLRHRPVQAPRARPRPAVPQARAQGPVRRRLRDHPGRATTPASQDELLRWMRREGDRPAGHRATPTSWTAASPAPSTPARSRAAWSPTSCWRSSSARPPAPTRAARSSWSSPRSRWWSRAASASRALYLSGHRDAEEIGRVLEMADAHDPADWRALDEGRLVRAAGRVPPVRARRRRRSPPTSSAGRYARVAHRPAARARARGASPRSTGSTAPSTSASSSPGRPASGLGQGLRAIERYHVGQAAPRLRAGGQGAAVRLPRLRRLLAAGHRVPVPREPLPEEPAQRPVRRRARRPVRGPGPRPASGPRPTGGSSRTARSSRCSTGRRSSRTTPSAARAPGANTFLGRDHFARRGRRPHVRALPATAPHAAAIQKGPAS